MPDVGTLRVRKVPIGELTCHPENPRHGDIDTIAASLEAHGQFRAIVVQESTGHICAGNHTYLAAVQLGWKQISAHVLDITDEQALQILLADNRTADLGVYNTRTLVDLLQRLPTLDGTGYDTTSLAELLEDLYPTSAYDHNADGIYTRRVDSPIYQPTQPAPPPVNELVDRTTTDELLASIEAAEELPGELRQFLIWAAERHTIFKFDRIAEFYAHQPAEVQALMEESVLVIIDYAQAVERGFVRLTKRLAAAFREDYPDA